MDEEFNVTVLPDHKGKGIIHITPVLVDRSVFKSFSSQTMSEDISKSRGNVFTYGKTPELVQIQNLAFDTNTEVLAQHMDLKMQRGILPHTCSAAVLAVQCEALLQDPKVSKTAAGGAFTMYEKPKVAWRNLHGKS